MDHMVMMKNYHFKEVKHEKKYNFLLSLLFSLTLASCNANNSISNNNSPQKHSMILTMYNYDEFINMNYIYY